MIASPILRASRNRRSTSGAGLLQVLGNLSDWKSAATVAFIFFVVSLAVAPAIAPDHRKLAAEINSKTLKAAAAIKISPRPANRIRD